MIPLEAIDIFIRENCEKVTVKNNGTHWNFRCPICGDSKKNQNKKRGHVDYNNGVPGYHCFNCGWHGSFIKFYSIIKNISEKKSAFLLNTYDSRFIKTRLTHNRSKEKNKKKEINDFSYILKDCISDISPPSSIAEDRFYNILQEFRKNRQIPQSFPLYYAWKGIYKDRIIIPIFQDNRLIYFQARSLNKNASEKYINPISEKSYIIFNKEKFNKDAYIIITEGILDAIAVGDQGTTILGASLDEKFIEKILKLTNKGIILAFDNDNQGKKSLYKFITENKYADICKYFLPENEFKDLNETLQAVSNINIYKFVCDNSYSKLSSITRLKIRRKM